MADDKVEGLTRTVKVRTVVITLTADGKDIVLRYPVAENHSPMVPAAVSSILMASNPPKITIEVEETEAQVPVVPVAKPGKA